MLGSAQSGYGNGYGYNGYGGQQFSQAAINAFGRKVARDFLAAGLIDHMHIVVVPILLGRGVRLWDGLEGLEKDYDIEATSSPNGVTHVTFTRTSA